MFLARTARVIWGDVFVRSEKKVIETKKNSRSEIYQRNRIDLPLSFNHVMRKIARKIFPSPKFQKRPKFSLLWFALVHRIASTMAFFWDGFISQFLICWYHIPYIVWVQCVEMYIYILKIEFVVYRDVRLIKFRFLLDNGLSLNQDYYGRAVRKHQTLLKNDEKYWNIMTHTIYLICLASG